MVFIVFGGEELKRPVVGCGFDGGHVFADGVAVAVVRVGAGHQFVRHVVDGDGVLVVCGLVVALGGDADESRAFDVEGELFGLCAFLGLLRPEGHRSSYYFLLWEQT